jgi:hypothetical protein
VPYLPQLDYCVLYWRDEERYYVPYLPQLDYCVLYWRDEEHNYVPHLPCWFTMYYRLEGLRALLCAVFTVAGLQCRIWGRTVSLILCVAFAFTGLQCCILGAKSTTQTQHVPNMPHLVYSVFYGRGKKLPLLVNSVFYGRGKTYYFVPHLTQLVLQCK